MYIWPLTGVVMRRPVRSNVPETDGEDGMMDSMAVGIELPSDVLAMITQPKMSAKSAVFLSVVVDVPSI